MPVGVYNSAVRAAPIMTELFRMGWSNRANEVLESQDFQREM